MMEQEPLLKQKLLLEKFPGKGGWTYARIPTSLPGQKNTFGWQKVHGFIDGYEVKQCHLMPMGKGQLFITVKAEIRKAIKKSEGDFVEVVLFSLEAALPVPDDFKLCLEDEPGAYERFNKLKEHEQKQCLDWIYSIKSEDVIVKRMADMINKLVSGSSLLIPKSKTE